jgi:hypothetical protein
MVEALVLVRQELAKDKEHIDLDATADREHELPTFSSTRLRTISGCLKDRRKLPVVCCR